MIKRCPTCKAEAEFKIRKEGFRAGQPRPECISCEKERMADYWSRNAKKRSDQRKSWRKRYRAKHGLSPGEKKRRAGSPIWRLRTNLRNRIRNAVMRARGSKSARTAELLGCSAEHFRLWMVFNLQPGMSLKNYGLWHVDHIRPCANFDLADSAQQRECFHYTNLQPLWAKDNLAKSDKTPVEEPAGGTPIDAFLALSRKALPAI